MDNMLNNNNNNYGLQQMAKREETGWFRLSVLTNFYCYSNKGLYF